MTKYTSIALSLVAAMLIAACSSTMKVGETKKIEQGKNVLGTVERVSETQMNYSYDRNGNGKVEKKVEMTTDKEVKTQTISKVHIDKDEDGVFEKVVAYDNGKPMKVMLFNSEKALTDEVTLNDKVATYVDIPEKAKRVYLKADGSVDRIEDLK